MMYKVVFHRYGKRYIEEEIDTLKEAEGLCEGLSDSGEGFPEYILDDSNIIVWDGKDGVIGIEHEDMIGKKYEEVK
ncbi:hypothetical protein P4639_14665 [Priestia megaterium]|uniref:hypothetical protein n=1 Tax=Priestia megaterium TaxID=1404 RepID=UPI002E1E088F|nr:hypothetical protein [Priestia megaterium]